MPHCAGVAALHCTLRIASDSRTGNRSASVVARLPGLSDEMSSLACPINLLNLTICNIRAAARNGCASEGRMKPGSMTLIEIINT